MHCLVCNKTGYEVTLYRVNAKGQKGVWVCKKHKGRTDAPQLEPEVEELIEVIAHG